MIEKNIYGGKHDGDGRGYYVNGLTFTGTSLNGWLMIISDDFPLKLKDGRKMHILHLPEEKEALTGQPLRTVIVSKQFYDDVMDDALKEKQKLNPVGDDIPLIGVSKRP